MPDCLPMLRNPMGEVSKPRPRQIKLARHPLVQLVKAYRLNHRPRDLPITDRFENMAAIMKTRYFQ